jgi:hypothetical protein
MESFISRSTRPQDPLCWRASHLHIHGDDFPINAAITASPTCLCRHAALHGISCALQLSQRARGRRITRFRSNPPIMRTLKLAKTMPKYGSKTLCISTCGGNMRMKVMKMFIIWMSPIKHPAHFRTTIGDMHVASRR